MKLSRHAKNKIRLYKVSADAVAELAIDGELVRHDEKGHPVREGTIDGHTFHVVTADADTFIITVIKKD